MQRHALGRKFTKTSNRNRSGSRLKLISFATLLPFVASRRPIHAQAQEHTDINIDIYINRHTHIRGESGDAPPGTQRHKAIKAKPTTDRPSSLSLCCCWSTGQNPKDPKEPAPNITATAKTANSHKMKIWLRYRREEEER